MGLWVWKDPGSGAGLILPLLMGVVFFAFALILIVVDLISFAGNLFERFFAPDLPIYVDYTKAEALFEDGNWQAAADAFYKNMEEDPHRLEPYVRGISAAVAAGDNEKLAAFQSNALRHLSPQNRNLLDGSLHRQKLPPLPPTSSPPKKRRQVRSG